MFLRTSPFQNRGIYYSNSKTIDFPIATDNSIEIVKAAINGLKDIFKRGYKYQKVGVMLSGLSNLENKNNLFSSSKDEKIKTPVEINIRFDLSKLKPCPELLASCFTNDSGK